ncbi:MAG: hypothetical protein HDS27_04960 [Bacteroides sp.]|nr:hypothetical protein [Bacteroides sp.]
MVNQADEGLLSIWRCNRRLRNDGNRITTMLEDADAVTQSGSMDYPGKNREMALLGV